MEWASFINFLGEREDSIGVINLCHAIGESPVISADACEYNDPDGKTKYYKFYHSGIEMGFRKNCLSHIHFYFGNEDEYSPFTGNFIHGIEAGMDRAYITKLLGKPTLVGEGKGIGRERMRNDQEIYKDIGTVLYSIAPDQAKKIIMRAELSPENDHCKYEYDYLDATDEIQWLTAGGRVNTDILRYLVELRNYYIENNLTNGRPAWHGCEVTLDIEKMKLNIDFRYDD